MEIDPNARGNRRRPLCARWGSRNVPVTVMNGIDGRGGPNAEGGPDFPDRERRRTMTASPLHPFLRITLALLLLLAAPAAARAGPRTFTGEAYDEEGVLVYAERHVLTYDDEGVVGSRTTYFDPEGGEIGSLVSDYAPSPQFCDYTFRDRRRGYVDGVRLGDDTLCLFRREDPSAPEETRCLPREENQIVGQGFHHFIRNRLDAIAEGKTYHVKLALPSRLDELDFRIRKTGLEGERMTIRLESDHWVVRLFAPHIDVVYDRERKRLLIYEGISNVADASGECIPVRIRYAY